MATIRSKYVLNVYVCVYVCMYVLGWCLWGLGGCRCDERGRLRQNHCRAFGCTSSQMLIVPYVLYLAYIQYFSHTLGIYVRT